MSDPNRGAWEQLSDADRRRIAWRIEWAIEALVDEIADTFGLDPEHAETLVATAGMQGEKS